MSSKDSVNDRILRLADTHSPEEISREIGGWMTPARVRLKLQELLGKNGRSWLDDDQREELVMWRLQTVIADLEKNAKHSLDHAKVLLQYLRTVSEVLDRRAKARDVDTNALYANQAQIMYDAIRAAFTDVLVQMRDIAPEITKEQADSALARALPQAVLVISERNLGDEVKEE